MSLFKVIVFAMLTIIMVLLLSIAVSMSQTYAAVTHPHECDCGEYQIDLELDGVIIYDGDRKVGFIPNEQLNTYSALDHIFIKDNE